MTTASSSGGGNREDLRRVRDNSQEDAVDLGGVTKRGEANLEDEASSEIGVRSGGGGEVPKRSYSAVAVKLPKISKVDVVVDEINGEKVSMIPDDIFNDVQPIWSDILIGRFVDKTPYVGVIHKICKQIWAIGGKDATIEVYKVGENTVKFVIRNQATRVKALRRRIWHIAGIPMTVEKCAPQSEIVDEVLTIVPLWVTLKGVPREQFNHKGLSYVASRVGEPRKLHMDTELCMKFDEAKVLVDVDLNGELPKSHRFRSKRGLMISRYILGEDTYWTIRTDQVVSWMVKKLLKFRELAKDFHKVEPRSGRQTQFWYDAWTDWGRLIDVVGSRGVIDLGIPLMASLSSLVGMRRRRHRLQFYNEVEDFIAHFAERRVEEDDHHLWRSGLDTYLSTFNFKKSWHYYRSPKAQVIWRSAVWFAHATPKFSFIHWLAELNRLPTSNIIRYWNSNVCSRCVLCKSVEESRDHLFFACRYSATVWRSLSERLLGDRFSANWEDIHQFLIGSGLGISVTFILRYMFQAVLYSIWMERNRRRHGHQERSEIVLTQMLRRMIVNRLTSVQELGVVKFRLAVQTWFSIQP